MSINRRKFLFNTGLTLAGVAATYKSISHTAFSKEEADSKDMSKWANVRAQFAVSPEYVHLSSFFLASHPRPVAEAVEKYRRALDDNPLLYIEEHLFLGKPHWMETPAAEYLGGKPEEIALTNSTTMGLAFAYLGMPLKAGQEILTTEHDHYSHHESIRLAAERAGASVKKISLFDDFKSISEDEIVSRITKAVTPKTRAVGITWVHSSSGLKLPLRQIAAAIADVNKNRAEADRALLVVDGVHGIGVEDEKIAETGIDIFVAGTHKWMFAPRGTGIMWAKSDMWKRMRPVIPSFSFEPYAAWMQGRKLDVMKAEYMTPGGFQAFEHFFAMPAAFEFHRQIGKRRVAERIHALNEQAKEGLSKMPNVKLHTPLGSKLSAGMICFDVVGMKPSEVVKKLLEKKIIASETPYGKSYARIAPSLLNTEEEIEKTLGFIRALG